MKGNPFPQFWHLAGPPPPPDTVSWWGAYGWSMATLSWTFQGRLSKGQAPKPVREEVAEYLTWLDGPVDEFLDGVMALIDILWSPPYPETGKGQGKLI